MTKFKNVLKAIGLTSAIFIGFIIIVSIMAGTSVMAKGILAGLVFLTVFGLIGRAAYELFEEKQRKNDKA